MNKHKYFLFQDHLKSHESSITGNMHLTCAMHYPNLVYTAGSAVVLTLSPHTPTVFKLFINNFHLLNGWKLPGVVVIF